MKLYTEEQVRKAFMDGSDFVWDDADEYKQGVAEYVQSVMPIELPSDEEVELKSVEYSTDTETMEFYVDCCWNFQNGAQWVIEQIRGGNK